MKKVLIRISKVILLLLLLIVVMGTVIIHSSWAQSRLTSSIAKSLSKDLNTTMTVGKVDIDLFKTLVLEDVYVEDQYGDTLAFIGRLEGDISSFDMKQRSIAFSQLALRQTSVHLYKREGETDQNIQFLIDYFSKSDKEKTTAPWDLAVDRLVLEGVDFRQSDYNKTPKADRLDFNYLHLQDIHADFQDIDIGEGSVGLRLVSMSASEQIGLDIESLTGYARFFGDRMEFEGMELITASSILDFDYSLQYEEFADLKKFEEKVDMEAEIRRAELNLSDIAYFAPAYKGMTDSVRLSGQLSGPVRELHGSDIDLRFGRYSQFKGDVIFSGLPDIDDTFIDINTTGLVSSIDELDRLPVPNVEGLLSNLGGPIASVGEFVFRGTFVGFANDFVVNGRLDTEVGGLDTDIAVVRSDIAQENRVVGEVRTEGIALGRLLDNADLGEVAVDVSVDVRGKDLETMGGNVKGNVSRFEYRGFAYKDITLDGDLEKGLFNGDLTIYQEEISMDFEGKVDTRGARPAFDFKASLYQADLRRLGLVSDRDSTSLTGAFEVEFVGDDADNFEGRIDVKGLSYCEGDKEFFFKDFMISSSSKDRDRTLSLRSTPVDMDMSGRFQFAELKDDLTDLMYDVLPAITTEGYEPKVSKTDIYFDISLKDTEQITDIFLPDWVIGDSTSISGRLDMVQRKMTLSGRADSVIFKGRVFEEVTLEAEKTMDLAYVAVENAYLQWQDSLEFRDNYLTLYARNNTLETDFTWMMERYNTTGSFALTGDVFSRDSVKMILQPSQLVVSDDYWTTDYPAVITYDKGAYHIDSLTVTNGLETIFASGEIADDDQSEFDFIIEDFQLEHLNKLIDRPLFRLEGVANVSGQARDIFDTFSIETDLKVDSLSLGGELMGDLDVISGWNTDEQTLDIIGALAKSGAETLSIRGEYFPQNEDERLDAVLTFNDFDLDVVNRLDPPAFSDIGGTAKGSLSVKGDFLRPEIDGALSFTDARVRIDFLNTTYTFSDKVIVEKDWIGFDQITFLDRFGNRGKANGTIIHENYREWNFDIWAEFEELLVLNTSLASEQPFYGTVFGTGTVSLAGYEGILEVDVDGRTDPGTTLELPLGESSEVTLESYVTFINEADSSDVNDDLSLTGVDLTLTAELTPDATIRMIFDESVGDVIEGNGTGNLTMEVNRKGDFNMYGQYEILKGEYLFTLQNVVNKRFDIERGSSIRFFGDPYDAELDIVARYGVRTSLYDVMYENPEAYRRRVPVEVEMKLTETLLSPDINFAILFPGMEPDLQTVVESRVTTPAELNKQVFALLVLNKFLPPDNSTGEGAAQALAGNTGAEFLSSQISNWLSQGFEDVDIGVNYRPGDQVTSDELAVALTTQLFNDRLLLQGNVGVQGNNSELAAGSGQASNIIGDFILEYMITEDGKLRLKVFNMTNDYDLLNIYQSRNTQGIGLLFQREFDGKFDDDKFLVQ